VFEAIWQEGFEDLSYSVLEAAFRKALGTCKFWPVKVADIRENVDRVHETAVSEAADLEWQRVLDLRRMYWSPDMPGGFSRGMPKLAERVDRAVRASGVFKLQDCEPEALHVWAKKRFIESYLAWAELEQEQFLLPDGELKDLLAGVAETKALPAPEVCFEDLHKHGLRYSEQIREAAPLLAVNRAVAARWSLFGSEEGREIALRALSEKETDPALADKIRAQKAALAAKGFSL